LEGKGRKDKEMVKRIKGSGDGRGRVEGEGLPRGRHVDIAEGTKDPAERKVQYNCFA
jgi:hypothetical protein